METHQAHVIVFGNEKGGTGKSTLAMHVVVTLLAQGKRVAVMDLDQRQRSLARYIENRKRHKREQLALSLPEVIDIQASRADTISSREAEEKSLFDQWLQEYRQRADFIVIDCPGNDTWLSRLAHATADTLVTPMNDSFVDLDLLGHVNAENFSVEKLSHYSELVWESRKLRSLTGKLPMDWVVTRNRLAMLHSRNNQRMDEALASLQKRIMFRYVPGLSERVIFRELFPKGLTLLDLPALGKMDISHVSARHELRQLVEELKLPGMNAA